MPSTPESNLRLELQAAGENATTWGIKTNSNLELLSQAIAGAANVNVGGSGNITLTASNYVSDEARAATLVLTGLLTGNRDVIVPTTPKHYTVLNQTTGAFTLTIRQSAGTGVAIPVGNSQIVCTSTTCVGVGIGNVARSGDTMTGALGIIAGTSATPGLFVAGDANTGFFQAAAAPDTLSISVGGVEVGRYGVGGFMRLAAGSAAAPAYSFSGDTDTGIYNPLAGEIALAINGSDAYRIRATGIRHQIYGTDGSSIYLISGTTRGLRVTTDASSVNLEGVDQTGVASYQALALKASEIVFATGSSPSERMRIPTSGPVVVNSGGLDVNNDLRFNSGYGSATLAFGVRAWVNFNGTGTVAIRGSGGVTSITDNGAGRYTMNFNFTMPDANYAALATGNANLDSFGGNRQSVMIRSRATTSLQVNTVDEGGLETDPSFLSVIVIR